MPHTKGPWVAENVGNQFNITLDRPDKPPIASVGGSNSPHAKANARLIAQAPELLRVTILFVMAYKLWNERKDGGEDDLHYAAKEAQQIIDKSLLPEDRP